MADSRLSAAGRPGLRESHGLAAGGAVVSGSGRHVLSSSAHATHGTFGSSANALDATLHTIATLLIAFAGRVGQIIGAVRQIITGFFAAHWCEENTEADTQPQADHKAFHTGSPKLLLVNVCRSRIKRSCPVEP